MNGGPRTLIARNLLVKAGGLTLLDNVSVSARRGELIGVIGPSGAGKSTFVKALCAFQPANKGTVLLDQFNLYEDFEHFRKRIGYVPQDDIIHSSLSVYKTLVYAGMLRLPPDVKKKAIEAKAVQVMAELELTERKNVKIRRLSGGQRKRVSIGVELMTSPDLMFLDEPTSGLDPGLEARMTATLKRLAQEGRIIFVTTHVMKSLELLDLLMVLMKGKLAYYGPSQSIQEYFGVQTFGGIFERLGQHSPADWQQKFMQSPHYSQYVLRT